jgi:hypothetical protein
MKMLKSCERTNLGIPKLFLMEKHGKLGRYYDASKIVKESGFDEIVS